VTDVKEEQRRQRGARPKQQTLIGNLIQDAMMSFTSLQEDEESDAALDPGPEEQSGVGAIPLSFGTFEGSHAATRLPAAEPSQINLAPPGGYEAGNLAALEDQGFDAPRGQSQPSRAPQSGGPSRPPPKKGVRGSARPPTRPLSPAGYPGHAPHLVPAPATAALPLRFWVLTATLVVAGVALAAYLAGIFS
jgi:hypothetical protein